MRGAALSLVALLALPAAAQETLSTEEFEAFATGRTLTYQRPGLVFGTEEYLPGRQVRWVEQDGICRTGAWYPRDGAICFTYSGVGDIACWTYQRVGDAVQALSLDEFPQQPYQIVESAAPLACTAAGEP
jgi:hypothetical protein